MHKNDLIRLVAGQTGLTNETVARVLNQTLDAIAAELAGGRRVVLTGFGTFELRERRRRRGVDPQTGADIVVEATRTPGFTASASLKQRVVHPVPDPREPGSPQGASTL